jgi:hypothetical protein
MNVRLVAYRKATSSATSKTAYNLDLQEAPNISVNYQFSEIREPEKRKGSHSQTFKLPFTDNNNQFFQDWYNVNLDTLVFSTRTKFDAVLYVGTVPQIEGSLQLKSVYKKAQVYEVVLMSSSATLFSTIGEQRLKDVFLKTDGSYSISYNHIFTYTNSTNNTLYNSWGNSLQNTAGVSLYDSDAGVSKIVYPTSITQENFYYNPNDTDADGDDVKRYLRLDSSAISAIDDSDISSSLTVSMSQFRPSIQLKTIVDLIFATSGFSYTSTFLNGSYFGKLFTTTGNHLELSAIPTTNSNANPSGFMDVGNSAPWGVISSSQQPISITPQTGYAVVEADTTTPVSGFSAPQDSDNIWNTTYNYFTKEDVNMSQISVKFMASEIGLDIGSTVDFQAMVRPFDVSTSTPLLDYDYGQSSIITKEVGIGGFLYAPQEHIIDISNMPTGASAQIVIEAANYIQSYSAPNNTASISVGGLDAYYSADMEYGLFSNIRIDWVGYSTDIYGATVDIPACIDPEITQKAFLKDIIQRFNLVVLTNPDDDTNLIIEPYNDFIASGELKHWTDKLDLDKEIVIKDTTEIQKKTIHLTDLEDEDLYNKEFKERFPNVNVYGHLKIEDFTNDFAKGELKNESIFSPFINSQVFASSDTQLGTYLLNFSPQYEISYEAKDGIVESTVVKTKPKLFYYNGAATTVKDVSNDTATYNLHRTYDNSGTITVQAFSFTTYPVCSPFDITPSSNAYTLTSANKTLYWNSSPPLAPNLTVFNYNSVSGSWFNNTLYGLYWKQYLDNIYSSEARIMECYLNLNEVDIFNFSFADEIFIRDTYWRILKISNYQVGAKASTKVVLIKSLDTKANCSGCDYVFGYVGDSNLLAGYYYLWCPEDDPGCTPDVSSGFLGAYTSPECCTCNGGDVMWNATAQASNGLYPCSANSGSLSIKLQSVFAPKNILSQGQLKTLIYNKLGGLNRPLVRGVNNTKYSKPMLPLYGDDIIIKYATKKRDIPQLEGESHRIILSGDTNANTRGYAYPEADKYNTPLRIPNNVNMIIRAKGIATVVGGSSSTYTLGSTEAFAYYTAFKNVNGTTTQLSTAGGQQEFSIREGANPTTCTLYIDMNNSVLRFGIQDSQTDTKRVWQLSAEIDVNRINNMTLGYGENWAIFQNSQNIELQNGDYLIWN